ncbi:DUF2807 domain-containing protein [Prolixibacteraceae bacterium JC049]|nr:DUF2807 domain-containing protein [Prolixibacteraceae bacterium JC049]
MTLTVKKMLVGAIALMFFGCNDGDYETHKSNGDLVTKEFKLEAFNGILVDLKCDVEVKPSTIQKVVVTASENVIDDLDTSVRSGIWNIDFKDDGIATINRHDFKVVIEVPKLKKIQMESSGTIKCDGFLTGDNLQLIYNSSGKVSVKSKTKFLNVNMDGSGSLELNGDVDELKILHDSSGNIEALGLKVKSCSIVHDGSGDARLYVLEKLKCNMDGSGDVFYKGNPAIEKTIDGSGQLIQLK